MSFKGQPVPSTTYQHGRIKVSDGLSVRVTVPANSGDIKAGQICLFDGFLGIAVRGEKSIQDVTPGNVLDNDNQNAQELILSIEQAEYETDQIDPSDTMAKGTQLYWDPVNKRLTEDTDDGAGTKYRPAGRVTAAKDENNVIWFILGPQIDPSVLPDNTGGGGEGEDGGGDGGQGEGESV
mgnify:CR=1 FL=1